MEAVVEQEEEEFELVPEVEVEEPSEAPQAEAEAAEEDERREANEDVPEEQDQEEAVVAAAAEEAEQGLGPEDITTEAEFRRFLEEGGRIELTERFSRLEPVSRSDIRVSDWLKEARTLGELQKAASGKLSEKELLEVLHLFFKRSLIVLRQA